MSGAERIRALLDQLRGIRSDRDPTGAWADDDDPRYIPFARLVAALRGEVEYWSGLECFCDRDPCTRCRGLAAIEKALRGEK